LKALEDGIATKLDVSEYQAD